MFIRPRSTMRRILNKSRGFSGEKMDITLIPLVTLGSIGMVLFQRSDLRLSNLIDVLAILFYSFMSGIIGLYLSSWILKITGEWLGGKGSARDIRFAIGWSSIIRIWALLIIIPAFIVYGDNFSISLHKQMLPDDSTAFVWVNAVGEPAVWTLPLIIIRSAIVILDLWTFFVFIKCLSAAQEFGFWKALCNVLFLFLAIVIIAVLIALPFIILAER